MASSYKVTYISHSGFLVETEKSYLLFDYWKGTIPELDYDKTLYVFVSHAHHDHYSKEIFDYDHACHEVIYVLSDDIIQHGVPKIDELDVHFIGADQQIRIADCNISTLKSTDEGVAFLVEVDHITIYHAGDLHWWEWPGEPEEENTSAIHNYQAEISKLKDQKIDCAFVVLDPRQEAVGVCGMDYFLSHVDATHIFPMHLWNHYELIAQFKEQHPAEKDRILDITHKQQSFTIE